MARVNNPCTICGKPGIAGMKRGAGKCLYHWNLATYGIQAAERARWGDFATLHSECNKARATYRPDWSQAHPWFVYIDGTNTMTCTDLDHVRTYLAGKNITFRGKP